MITKTPSLSGGTCEGCYYAGEAGCQHPNVGKFPMDCVEAVSKRGVRYFIYVDKQARRAGKITNDKK